MCRNRAGKANSNLYLNLARGTRTRRTCTCVLSMKGRPGKNEGLLLNGVQRIRRRLRYSLPTFNCILQVRSAFRCSRLLNHLRKPEQKMWIKLKNIWKKWQINKFMGPSGMHPCLPTEIISWFYGTELSVKGYGDEDRFLKNGKEQILLVHLGKANRRSQETSGWSASPTTLRNWGSRYF